MQDLTPLEAMKRLKQHFGSREGMLTQGREFSGL